MSGDPDNPARITRFWQAAEIFSPQQLPPCDPKKNTVDIYPGEPMPWEPGSRQDKPKDGYVWRHMVYGGVYSLSHVRDALLREYGDDDSEPPAIKGESALFACIVDADGFLVDGSSVVSECAWAVGRISQDESPLTGFREDTQRHADDLGRMPDAKAGLRLLAAAIRGAVPDGVASGVTAAVAGALTAVGGPLAAAAGSAAGTAAKTIVTSAIGTRKASTDGTSSDTTAGGEETDAAPGARLDLAAITGQDLQRFSAELASRLDVRDVLRPNGVRVRSYQVKTDSAEDDDSQPFLNSFLANDLDQVATALATRDAGAALTSYLASSGSIDGKRRTDVREHPRQVLDGCQPDLIPPGRWVTDTDRPLAFSQQFAVNQIMRAHGARQPGLFAVNGPPGTGKTTMLRDLIAAIIVERATELASFSSPRDAFTGMADPWQTDTYTHRISTLSPALTGYEIVVASSNNTAVENVTAEIPGPKGIGAQWREAAGAVGYFTATAAQVTGDGAWALIAAVLGNAANRGAFVTRFWSGGRRGKQRSGAGMLDVLNNPAEVPSWRGAVSAFRESLATVQALSAQRSVVSAHITRLSESLAARDQAAAALRQATEEREGLDRRLPSFSDNAVSAAERWQGATAAMHAHGLARPGRFSVLSPAGRRARREWAAGRAELAAGVVRAQGERDSAERSLSELTQQITERRAAEDAAQATFASCDAWVGKCRRVIADARQRWGDRVPDGPEYAETRQPDLIERRELSAPWADEEFSRARTELFLAALALHKAFILTEAKRIRANLSALMDVLDGKGRPGPAALLAAWQTLFLVVPVVSSTFASFGRLFAGLGRESIGWLLVDEAGQATPQNAVGALWRSRTAVIVGDPLQLEPVVTLPWGGQQALLREYGVPEEWAPGRTSVQQVADRLATAGTWLPGAAREPVWVGTPLRVHRRCDRPMFEVSNRIAYNGLMVFGTQKREPFHGNNAWYDVRSSVSEGHWIPAEGEALAEMLGRLRDAGIQPGDIRVLSPFRAVAVEAGKIHASVFPSVRREQREKLVGTVHIMQGREADAVIMVLGGDPEKPGARRFATSAPNLLNVAVSRAKRRFYVIGNYGTWGNEPYFTELKDPELMRRYRPQ